MTLVNQEKAAAEAMGLKVVEASAASSAEVLAAGSLWWGGARPSPF